MLCDILLAHVLGCDRSALLLSLDRKLEEADARRMAEAVSELSLGVPVQYIVGSCWFYNREIKVGRGCFIPRGDTEFLAAAAVAALPRGQLRRPVQRQRVRRRRNRLDAQAEKGLCA